MEWTTFEQRIRHLSQEDRSGIKSAFEMGRKAHEGQIRQSGEPYFSHPVAVATIMVDLGADRDSIIASLLHDTVEDTPVTLEDIRQTFGDDVATLVDGATKLMESEKGATTDEKIETLRKIFTYMEKDIRIMVLKLADRLHNMRTIEFRSPEKQKAVAKETLDVYVKIADRLCMRDMRNELEELCYDVLEPTMKNQIRAFSEENKKIAGEKMKEIKAAILASFPDETIELSYKPKNWKRLSLEYKIGKESEREQNSIGIVVVCESVDDCYHKLGVLHHLYQREAQTFEDFINLPAINGYQGLHTTIIMEDGTRVRCKMRTREMDQYAHKGIATKCFDSKSVGVIDYLPWTKRISPLANDTKERSEEFWSNLQSDILSESVIVYGPQSSALVPEGATALDAALHLFPEEALRLKRIYVNGKEASPSQRIERGSFVELETSADNTVKRDWLFWVHTGMGVATIRTALGSQKGGALAESGKAILQQTLTERGQGYLEEFDPALLLRAAKSLKFDSMNDIFKALAQRRVEPNEFLSAIRCFSQNGERTEEVCEEKEEIVYRFTTNRNIEDIRKLLNVYEKFSAQTKGIRLLPGMGGAMHFRVRIALSPEEESAYTQELSAAGAKKIHSYRNDRLSVFMMAVVVFCWALNPVWAKYILSAGMSPVSLVSLRSIIFGALSVVLYAGWRAVRKVPYAPIPNVTSLALLPTVATYFLSFFTYTSVAFLPPSVHLTVLRFNVVLLPLLHLKKTKVVTKAILLQVLTLAVFGVLFLLTPDISYMGYPLAIIALVTYLIYSLITENVLQKNKIGLRYPHFLLHMGLMLAALGLLSLPWVIAQDAHWLAKLPMVCAYVLVCVFIPHTCFQLILQRTRFQYVTSLSLFEVPLGIAMEALLLGIILSPATYAVIVAALLTLAFALYKREFSPQAS